MLLGSGQIQHSGVGATVIGMWDRQGEQVAQDVAAVFSKAEIVTTVAADIRPVIWSKLFANVGINAITALTGIRNGQLLDLEESRALVKSVVMEAVAVARALQVPVADDALDNVFAIAGATSPNRSSMGQDVDARRATEIDAINGYIVRRAGELGLEVPVNQSLTSLVKTLQAHYIG
jgi:2-dehydropantoate 2-reductase